MQALHDLSWSWNTHHPNLSLDLGKLIMIIPDWTTEIYHNTSSWNVHYNKVYKTFQISIMDNLQEMLIVLEKKGNKKFQQ